MRSMALICQSERNITQSANQSDWMRNILPLIRGRI